MNFKPLFSSTTCLIINVSVFMLNAQNLVPNPSFENYTSCPSSSSQLNLAIPWVAPTVGTPDYFNACSSSNFADVPVNFYGSQNARTGDAYAQCVVFPSIGANFREYIQAKLISPLIAGQNYNVSFFISLADNSNYASNNIGAYISTLPPTSGLNVNLPFIPQINETSVITDVANWTLVSDLYTAIGGEEYITIGNFYNDASTSTVVSPLGNSIFATFYLVDDVCISPVGGSGCLSVLPIDLVLFNVSDEGEAVKTYWSTATEINNEYFTVLRSKDAINFEPIVNIDGSGNSSVQLDYMFYDDNPLPGSSYYQLKQTDFDGGLSYSNVVTVNRDDKMDMNIYPNPANNNIVIKGIQDKVEIQLYNSFGELVHQQALWRDGSSISLNRFSEGVYVLKIIDAKGILTVKKLIIRH